MLEPTAQQKNLFHIMNSGKGFQNPLEGGSSALSGKLSGVASHVSGLTSLIGDPTHGSVLSGAGLTAGLMTKFTASATKGTEHVTKLVSYGQKSVGEFSQRMQIANSYSSTMKRFTDSDPGCGPFSGAMGVAQHIGQAAMDTYHSVMETVDHVIAQLNDAIQKGLNTVAAIAAQVTTAINNAIAAAEAFANKVVTAIEDELNHIADMVTTSAHAWLSSHLTSWFGDSCKSDTVNKISTPALKTAATHS